MHSWSSQSNANPATVLYAQGSTVWIMQVLYLLHTKFAVPAAILQFNYGTWMLGF